MIERSDDLAGGLRARTHLDTELNRYLIIMVHYRINILI